MYGIESDGKLDYYDIRPILQENEDLRTIVWLIAEAFCDESISNYELTARLEDILQEIGAV